MLYRMIFVKPVLDTTSNGQVLDETKQLAPFTGKTIGEITIDRKQVFDPGGKWLERTANKTHMLTRERVIRRDLLFKPGEELDPQLIVRTKQLLRSRDYIADIEIDVKPDSIGLHARQSPDYDPRTAGTISADGALHSEGRTMVGLSDANILGTGNSLKVMTNFSRNDFSYGGNMVEYEIPKRTGDLLHRKFQCRTQFLQFRRSTSGSARSSSDPPTTKSVSPTTTSRTSDT